jgi:antitoxin component YwqK of YwqJK toxin-antitoxin module
LEIKKVGVYHGQVDADGKSCGIGRWVNEGSGSISEGQFKQGDLNGYARVINSKGVPTKYYLGEFKDHKREGQGIEYYKDGSIKSGQWKNNSFIQ